MFDGAESPLTQTFGLGIFEDATAEHLDEIEAFFREREAPVFHEVSPMTDPSLMTLLGERGYRPVELTSVMYRELSSEVAKRERRGDLQTRVITADEVELWARTSADDWRTAQPPEMLDSFAASVEQQAEQTLRRFIALLCQGDRQARSIARGLLAGLRQGPLPTAAALARGLDWLRTVDLRQSLPMITVDTLLIHGDQDPLNPLAAARWLSARLPRGRLEVFAGAAHAPFFADRDRFVDLLDDFCHARTAA